MRTHRSAFKETQIEVQRAYEQGREDFGNDVLRWLERRSAEPNFAQVRVEYMGEFIEPEPAEVRS